MKLRTIFLLILLLGLSFWIIVAVTAVLPVGNFSFDSISKDQSEQAVQTTKEKDSTQEKTRLSQLLGSVQIEQATSTPTPTPEPIPNSYVIPQQHHTFQTFNNCGPASLAMQLSYFGETVTQQTLGNSLRPYQHPTGNNDDKSVTLYELASEAEKYGYEAVYRPNGTPKILRQLIANDLPVVIRTWLEPGEDIGHYRLVRGYNQSNQTFSQDDSLQGANLTYTVAQLNEIWQPFNYEYLVIFPEEKKATVQQILGEEYDRQIALRNAKQRIQVELTENPNDLYATFNLSVTEYNLGNYQASIEAFEKVEDRLPGRMLWYQIEPILAYYELGQYQQVIQRADNILNNNNRAFSELYHLKGRIYQEQGDIQAAREQYRLAIQYNQNYQPAKDALTATASQ